MVVAYILGAFVIATTLLSTLRLQQWWVRICDFPRVHFLLLGLSVIGLWVSFGGPSIHSLGNTLFIVCLAVACIWQMRRILPFTPLWPRQVHRAQDPTAKAISVLISNVQMDNRNVEALLRFVKERRPHILLLLECDDWWIEQLEKELVDYPHSLLEPRDDTYGMALYSRLELVQPQTRFIATDEAPSFHTGVRLKGGDLIRFHGVHPPPPVPEYAEESTERDAELMVVGREAAQDVLPCIVAGDLNDVAWSDTTRLFRTVSGLLDPRIGRGTLPTFPAHLPLLRFPLDHIFFSADFRLIHLERGPQIGSDHLPIFVKVSYEPTRAFEQEPETYDPQAEAEADELEGATETA